MLAHIAWHQDLEAQLLQAARDRAPRELVAALAGNIDGSTAHVHQVAQMHNIATDHDSFVVDPCEFARLECELRQSGQTLLGFAHSHPSGPATPSLQDRAQLWTGYVQVITDGVVCRAFVFASDRSSHELQRDRGPHTNQAAKRHASSEALT